MPSTSEFVAYEPLLRWLFPGESQPNLQRNALAKGSTFGVDFVAQLAVISGNLVTLA